MNDDLVARTEAWIAADPDPETRGALSDVLGRARATGDDVELADLMGLRLDFGTAGLRGEMGPGSNRLNRLMARQTAAGLARTLHEHGERVAERGVIVGHDARHHSERFALDTVEVLEAAGIPCMFVAGDNPTPLIAWGVRHLGAVAGVVVTASHNPAKDNGIKIYWGDGAQIIPPVDGWIAADIDVAAAGGNPPGPERTPTPAPASLVDDYVAMVTGLVAPDTTTGIGAQRAALRIASTAMHGVGAPLLRRCLDAAGFVTHRSVARQEIPDPDFPTVPFPNPEEPGATDLLLALARDMDADVALANDPDADRLAVGIRSDDPEHDGYRMLSGDELGALLAAGLMADRAANPRADGRRPLLVTTVVSSQLLARIAADTGADFHETLTGFKWLCRPAFADPSLDQVLAYEESIGYAVGGLCDKDGISAAVVTADMLARWNAAGIQPQQVLDDLARAHGAHVQGNFSIRVGGPGWAERLAATAADVVAAPPTAVAGSPVERMDQPADDVIRLFLANGDRVVIRPSGTEPKLKCYCEAVEPVADGEAPADARRRAAERLTTMHDELTARLAP
ncbi:MAG: phospho-sugar mutase [Acidimicrobiales bacterium]